MKRSSRSLRENGIPGACRPRGRWRDCYLGALTLGRATAVHLGFGCPMILLPPSFIFGYLILSWVSWSRGLGLGIMTAGRGGGSGIGCRATCPISFHFITFHNDWAVLYMGHNVDSSICCIYILTINIFWIWSWICVYMFKVTSLFSRRAGSALCAVVHIDVWGLRGSSEVDVGAPCKAKPSAWCKTFVDALSMLFRGFTEADGLVPPLPQICFRVSLWFLTWGVMELQAWCAILMKCWTSSTFPG